MRRDSASSTRVERTVAWKRAAMRCARSLRLRVAARKVPSKNSSASKRRRSQAPARSSESLRVSSRRRPPSTSYSMRCARRSISKVGRCRVRSSRPAPKRVTGPAATSRRERTSGLMERSPANRWKYSAPVTTTVSNSARRLERNPQVHPGTRGGHEIALLLGVVEDVRVHAQPVEAEAGRQVKDAGLNARRRNGPLRSSRRSSAPGPGPETRRTGGPAGRGGPLRSVESRGPDPTSRGGGVAASPVGGRGRAPPAAVGAGAPRPRPPAAGSRRPGTDWRGPRRRAPAGRKRGRGR